MNHAELIESVLEVCQAKTGRFRKTVIEAIPDLEPEDVSYLRSRLRMRPDAYMIDGTTVVCFECEHTNPVHPWMAEEYMNAHLALDQFGWDLVLVRVSDCGWKEIPGAALLTKHIASLAHAANA